MTPKSKLRSSCSQRTTRLRSPRPSIEFAPLEPSVLLYSSLKGFLFSLQQYPISSPSSALVLRPS